MPVYTYSAMTSAGAKITDTIDVDTESDVIAYIQKNEMFPISVKRGESAAKKEIKFEINFKKKIGAEDLYLTCKQFYTMLHAGITILDAIETVADQTKNKRFKQILNEIHAEVSTGIPFSKALQRYGDTFPSLYVSMIETGEVTGNLEGVMERLAVYYENDYKTTSQVKSAMIYPTVLLILTLVMVVFMLVFIMPTFAEMFQGSGMDLPKPTQALMDASDAIIKYWYFMLGGIIALIVIGKKVSKFPSVIAFIDRLKLKLPVVKLVVTNGVTFKTCRSLGIMLASGVSLFEGLEICSRVAGNTVGVEAIAKCRADISEGISFGRALERSSIFPKMMVAMVRIGENAGVLDGMLDEVADYYQEELNTAIRNLVTVLEPLMIVVMAGGIGCVAVAILMPMFQMMETIG